MVFIYILSHLYYITCYVLIYSRCIVMVGLPYPNLRSAELKEKMEYLNVNLVSETRNSIATVILPGC